MNKGHLEASVLPDAGLLRFEVSVRVAELSDGPDGIF